MCVLDDGSRDRTAAVASDAARRLPVQVVSHGHTRGLARAMETALRWVLSRAGDQDVIVTMDADNTHPADLLPAMVGAIQGGADVVIASRYTPGGVEEGVPPSRRILSRGIGALMRLRFRLPGVRDYTSGYRAYRARLLRAAAARYGPRLIEARGFTVTAELLVKLHPFHPRIVEVPVHLRYDRKRGGSKMGVLRTVREYLALLCSRPLGRHAEKGVGA
jgi:dolichol-phosphate mannosyltransferase